MKINFFIGDELHEWSGNHDIYVVREDHYVNFKLSDLKSKENPSLFIEDYRLNLTESYDVIEGRIFYSESYPIFRESFGLSTIRIYLENQSVELHFEVIVKKVNAQQVEEMIHYLTQKHEDIIRICLSRTTLSMGVTELGISDPETVLKAVEKFVNTITDCRLELQRQLRKRLVPVKQPAWKSTHGSDIDPFDVILNLDALEPRFGESDVMVNGRSFSINNMEVTTLQSIVNVEENTVLIGGLYSMRRVIINLLERINSDFSYEKIAQHDHKYVSLNSLLLRLTSSNMKQRCEEQLFQLEGFIRYFEQKIGLIYKGEHLPKMTPFVRASKIYKRLFEQLYEWYKLGEPTLDGGNYLVKLRSISKIYEFVSLFKLIDFLNEKKWQTQTDSSIWNPEFEFVPSTVCFEKNSLKLTLNYEKKIHLYSENTRHLDLIDMDSSHFYKGKYNYRCPDFVLRLDNFDKSKTIYLILDAKYSTLSAVQKYHLPELQRKYFDNMAVYDANDQSLKQDAIIGVIALFPGGNSIAPIYLPNIKKFGIDKKPIKFPIVAGLSILPEENDHTIDFFEIIIKLLECRIVKNM
jgi:hypothetical protein